MRFICKLSWWRRSGLHVWRVIGFTSGGLSSPDLVHVECRRCGTGFTAEVLVGGEGR